MDPVSEEEAAGDSGEGEKEGFHIFLTNSTSFLPLSLSSALLGACSRTLISFNKHQIPEQAILCTCETAGERGVCVYRAEMQEKICFVMTVSVVHVFVLL